MLRASELNGSSNYRPGMKLIAVVVLGLVCALLVVTGVVAAAAALVLARRRAGRETGSEEEPDGPSEM
ncbi:MAG: hypothetical protein JWO79_3244 [Actinomycetia bacterium]|nr:hypothetical protein [Actinomycetes bacterium]MDQ1658820.1 hypothetical protein [Cryptosporangiaceae bacterium]